jgi:ERCC4-related helicase
MKIKYYLVTRPNQTDCSRYRNSDPLLNGNGARVWSQIVSSKGAKIILFTPYRTTTEKIENLVQQIRDDRDVVGKIRVVINSHACD